MSDGPFRIRLDVIGLFGVIVGLAGLYTYYKGTNAKLEIVIESATNVVDVNERVAGLSVVFNGEDFLQRNKALTIYSLTLRNNGNESIRKDDFDASALVGVSLPGATILNAQLDPARTSSEPYIRENARFHLQAPSSVFLRPVILDPGDRIGLRVVAVHGASTRPRLTALGKVVGQKEIPVMVARDTDESAGVWSRAVGGGLGVNLLRLPIYFFAFLILLIPAIGIPVGIGNWRDKRKRKRIAQEYMSCVQETPWLKWMVDTYVGSGTIPLEKLEDLVANPDRHHARRYMRGVRIEHGGDLPPGVVIDFDGRFGSDIRIRSGIFSYDENRTLVINEIAKKDFDSFLKYLREKGEIEESDSSATAH